MATANPTIKVYLKCLFFKRFGKAGKRFDQIITQGFLPTFQIWRQVDVASQPSQPTFSPEIQVARFLAV